MPAEFTRGPDDEIDYLRHGGTAYLQDWSVLLRGTLRCDLLVDGNKDITGAQFQLLWMEYERLFPADFELSNFLCFYELFPEIIEVIQECYVDDEQVGLVRKLLMLFFVLEDS